MIRRFALVTLVGCCLGYSARAVAAEAVDFEAKVLPVFVAHCVKCHGPDKQSGKLRLDSAKEIAAFGEESLLVAGKPDESELLERITLPEKDRKRMPKGAPPLKVEEIAVIRDWIAAGATLTSTAAPAADGGSAAEASAEPAPPRTPTEEDPELTALPPASAEAIAKIEAAGGAVMPLFGESPLLQVSFAQAPSPPGDEALATLEGAADNIVWLNLGKAQATAAGYAHIAKLKNLIQLHLEQSSVDDAALGQLASLPRLEYVNVYGTSVTDAGVSGLKSLAKLRNLYVWQTKVSWDAAQALQAAIPGLEVNLGWDHPQVVKLRVTKELETAKEIAKTAETRAAELEQQFTAAKQAKEQTAARVKELEEQLKGLKQPADAEKAEGDDST